MATFQPLNGLMLTVCAASYTVRAFLRQFQRADDEAGGCAACPAARHDTQPDPRSEGRSINRAT